MNNKAKAVKAVKLAQAINVLRDDSVRNETVYFAYCGALHEVFRQIATIRDKEVKAKLMRQYHKVKRMVFVIGYDYALNAQEQDYIQPHFLSLATALGDAVNELYWQELETMFPAD